MYIGLNDTAAATGRQAPCTGAAGPNSGLASWGLANFTLYITAFHNEVIYISNKTEGFIMSGMRLRINPFVFTWGPYQVRTMTPCIATLMIRVDLDAKVVCSRCLPAHTHSSDAAHTSPFECICVQASRDRLPAWNISNLGNVMDIHGVNNRYVVACSRCTHTYTAPLQVDGARLLLPSSP